MSRNYTTKTTFLRAVTIDGRQIAVSKKLEVGGANGTVVSNSEVSTDSLMIKPNDTDERVNVLSLINDAAKAGIDVGTTDNDYENVSDTTGAFANVQKINFKGKYVNIVPSIDKKVVTLWINENNNYPQYGGINESGYKQKQIYSFDPTIVYPPDEDYTPVGSYPPGIRGNGETYPYALIGGTDGVLNLVCTNEDGGNVISVPSDNFKVTVKAYSYNPYETDLGESTTTVFSEAAIDGTQERVQGENKFTSVTTQLQVYNIKKYTEEDAKDGFTPNTISCSVNVSITNDILNFDNYLHRGGSIVYDTYVFVVEIGDKTFKTNHIFVYKNAETDEQLQPIVTSATATLQSNSTKTISGITYSNDYDLVLTGVDIKRTQIFVTNDNNRLQVLYSLNTTNPLTTEVFDKNRLTFTNESIMGSTGSNDSSTVFHLNDYHKKLSANTARKISGNVIFNPYGQNGVSTTKNLTKTVNGTEWVWTNNLADTNLITNFCSEDNRLGVCLDSSGRKIIGSGEFNEQKQEDIPYDSTWVLTDAWCLALLIQDGKLRYPSLDVTGTWTSVGTQKTKYYARKFNFNGSGNSVETFKIKVSGITSFGTGIRLFLTDGYSNEVQQLNAVKGTGLNGIATTDKVVNNQWTVEPNKSLLGSGNNSMMDNQDYYLVVEMDGTGTKEIGQITISK